MALDIAAAGLLLYVGADVMVLPKPQFSLFNFKFIQFWGVKAYLKQAGAGAAISADVYTVPDGSIVWLQSVAILTQKTTATEVQCFIKRKVGTMLPLEHLIVEDSTNNKYLCWPQHKAASTLESLAWLPLFLHEGDIIRLTHDLTAAETINDTVALHMVEYTDPRYKP